jgi:hypothetical protein
MRWLAIAAWEIALNAHISISLCGSRDGRAALCSRRREHHKKRRSKENASCKNISSLFGLRALSRMHTPVTPDDYLFHFPATCADRGHVKIAAFKRRSIISRAGVCSGWELQPPSCQGFKLEFPPFLDVNSEIKTFSSNFGHIFCTNQKFARWH